MAQMTPSHPPPTKHPSGPRIWIGVGWPFGNLLGKLGRRDQEGQPAMGSLRPDDRTRTREAEVHVRRGCAQLWLPGFWHPEQEPDCSVISSLLAVYQSLVSSRARIRKTAFPRKISLSETLTIGPPSREVWVCGEGGMASRKGAGEVLEQEHNSLSSVIRDGTQLKLRDLALNSWLLMYK